MNIDYKDKIHHKLLDSIESMIIDHSNVQTLPFYGYFNLSINFVESKDIPTCGVNVGVNGPNFYFSSDFLDSLTQKEVNFITLHEDFHLLWDHPQRTERGNFDRELANIAQDMIINYIILEDIKPDFIELPKYKTGELKGKTMALLPPIEYKGELIFEELYEWLKKEKEKKSKKVGDEYGKYSKVPFGIGDGWRLDKILDGLSENGGQWMDKHIEDGPNISKEYRDTIIKNIKDNLNSRGYTTSSIEKTLNKLKSTKKDYLKELKRYYNNNITGSIKRKSITKPSRRSIKGLKGKRKSKSVINVILDVSGSMNGEFEKVLSFIYQDGVEINLIKADTEVKGIEKLSSKKDIQNINIIGLGGTILQPAVDEVSKNWNDSPTVILTDGFCDSLNFIEIKKPVLILSTSKKVNTLNLKKGKQIIIK